MNSKKRYQIEVILKIGGVKKRLSQALDLTFNVLAQRHPSLNQKQIQELKEEFGEEQYFEQLINLFETQFSDQELEEIKKFWSSSAGKKLNTGNYAKKEQELANNWSLKLYQQCEHKLNTKEN